MSYILDALRKSETERRQGKIPDLGQPMQLIHRPRKKRVSPVVWVAVALMVNALVLAYVFWPQARMSDQTNDVRAPASAKALDTEPAAETVPATEARAPTVAADTHSRPDESPAGPVATTTGASEIPAGSEASTIITPSVITPAATAPTVITPSTATDNGGTPVLPEAEFTGRVPHLVELPVSFQKSIPDLIFNSHIYSTDPAARRVMINDRYLRPGESFDGIRVETVTEDGVVLSKQGQRFRVGSVRDWMSPR